MLDAWSAAPARFREDANTEEDFALGGYRDRLIVELAQNAADAASGSGVLSIRWDGATLTAANTGAPLDRDGVVALSSLRASAKDGGTVGRFGVGFSAVLAVSDEPRIVSRTGGVCFSAARTRAEVERIPSLAAELEQRSGHVPALRLPWACDGEPPAGFDTVVVLPVRPEMRAEIPGLLAAVPAELLLSLRGLSQLRIGERVVTRTDTQDGVVLQDGASSTTWHVSTVDGRIPAGLLADRPTEERRRDRWEITWAVPAGAPVKAGVLHAPTPSAQPVSVPALLIGTFPLDPDRRHVAAGPLTDYLVERAGERYAALVQDLPDEPALLRLVPRPQLSADPFDAAVVETCLGGFRSVWDAGRKCVLERDIAAAADVLADAVNGLLGAEWSAAGYEQALRLLGVRRLSAVDIVELASTVERPPEWWNRLYDGMQDASDRDALAGLPVPLADGRMVTGARGAYVIDEDLPAAAALGLRVIAPAAAHPLLERLGARRATPLSLLGEEAVRAAVAESFDATDPEPVAEAVLDLLAAAGSGPGEAPWLAELALLGDDGEWYPAGEMVLPGSPLDRIAAADAPYGRPSAAWVQRWGADVLCAAGVLRTLPVIRADEVVLGDGEVDLDGEAEWYDALDARLPAIDLPITLVDIAAVGDLELVGAWPEALQQLAAEPLRSVVARPAVAVLPDGARVQVPSYTRWWLSTHPVLGGRRPDGLSAGPELAGLYEVTDVDPDLADLVGVRSDLAEILADPDGAIDLLRRLGDSRRRAGAGVLPGIYGRIAAVLRDDEVDPPDFVRIGPERVVPREDVVVLDVPYAAPLLESVPLGGDAVVADLLDVPLASALVRAAVVESAGETSPWRDVPGAEVAARRCGAAVPDTAVVMHAPLRVGGHAVPWWPDGDRDHVSRSAGAAALGRALAWRLGRWDRRAAAAEAFADPDADRLTLEDALE